MKKFKTLIIIILFCQGLPRAAELKLLDPGVFESFEASRSSSSSISEDFSIDYKDKKWLNFDNSLSFYINKGLAYVFKEDFEAAVKVYDEGLKIYPNYHLLWYNRGIALEKLNRIEEAIDSYQKTITLNCNNN